MPRQYLQAARECSGVSADCSTVFMWSLQAVPDLRVVFASCSRRYKLCEQAVQER